MRQCSNCSVECCGTLCNINDGMENKEGEYEKDISINDRELIDVIKENMMQEKKWNMESIEMLKNEVEYLKVEITHKNTIIEDLLVEVFKKIKKILKTPIFIPHLLMEMFTRRQWKK